MKATKTGTLRAIAAGCLFAAALAGCQQGADGTWQPAVPAWNPFEEAPQPGADQYAVLLVSLRDPVPHVEMAKRHKEGLAKYAKWDDVYIVHKEGHSDVYRGRYRSIEAAQGHLKAAKRYISPNGTRPYASAIVVPLPGKNPGPAEWDLSTAPGAYSVVIAIFYDVPEAKYFGRKKFAVDYCRQLREEKGEQAYYRHGPAQSSVCIGTFPEDAVQMVKDEQGRDVRPEVRDRRIHAIMAKYPYLADNGRERITTVINPRTGRPERIKVKTYPVHIPKKGPIPAPGALGAPGPAQAPGTP